MSMSLARALLQVPASESSWDCMLESQTMFIWDEHGEEVDDWNKMVAQAEGLPEVEVVQDDDIFYRYRDQQVLVPFQDERGDNLIGVHTLAKLVERDSDMRFCRDSWHSSDVAFLALSPAQWRLLEDEFGLEAVERRFLKIDADFETFCGLAFADPGVVA